MIQMQCASLMYKIRHLTPSMYAPFIHLIAELSFGMIKKYEIKTV